MVLGQENKPIGLLVQKIAKECEECGCSPWTVTKIVKEISQLENASEKQLRKKVLELLNRWEPKAAQVYSSFQKMLVRTSGQKIEHFDRGNIVRSLLKETDVARGIAEKIGYEVEDKIKDLEISYISTALIREMVNVKLLEYGHENTRNQYARLGLPVYDIRRKVARLPYSNREMMIEYNLLRVIPRKLGELHLRSDIFIASLEDFSTKPISYCCAFESCNNLNETIFFNLKRMNALSALVSWPINASSVNATLLPFCSKGTLKKSIGLFLSAFESVFCNRTAIARNIGINLFSQESLRDVDMDLMACSANIFLKESMLLHALNAKLALAIDTKYKLKLLGKNFPENSIVLNCKDKNLFALNGIASEQNLCGLFGLNLAKAAIGSKENEFFGRIDETLKAIKEIAELKRNILAKREYLAKVGIAAKDMLDCIGLYGIVPAAMEITASKGEKEIPQFAEKIVSHISKELDGQFIITELLNKTGIRRFESENKRKENHELSMAIMSKGNTIMKEMQLAAIAKNKKELNDLIEKDAALIEIAALNTAGEAN